MRTKRDGTYKIEVEVAAGTTYMTLLKKEDSGFKHIFTARRIIKEDIEKEVGNDKSN